MRSSCLTLFIYRFPVHIATLVAIIRRYKMCEVCRSTTMHSGIQVDPIFVFFCLSCWCASLCIMYSSLVQVWPLHSSFPFFVFLFCSNWHRFLCYSVVASEIPNPNSCCMCLWRGRKWACFMPAQAAQSLKSLQGPDVERSSSWPLPLACGLIRVWFS